MSIAYYPTPRPYLKMEKLNGYTHNRQPIQDGGLWRDCATLTLRIRLYRLWARPLHSNVTPTHNRRNNALSYSYARRVLCNGGGIMQVGELYTYRQGHASKDWGLLLLVSATLRTVPRYNDIELVYRCKLYQLDTQRYAEGTFTHTEFTRALTPVTRNVTP